MVMGMLAACLAASLLAAACGLLCLREARRLRQGDKPPEGPRGAAEETEDGDETLREGILNLMRYAPTEKRREE